MKHNKMVAVTLVGMFAIWASAVVGTIYVIAHFIAKVW